MRDIWDRPPLKVERALSRAVDAATACGLEICEIGITEGAYRKLLREILCVIPPTPAAMSPATGERLGYFRGIPLFAIDNQSNNAEFSLSYGGLRCVKSLSPL